MDDKIVEEPKEVKVDELLNRWLLAQKDVCEIIVSLVNMINEQKAN